MFFFLWKTYVNITLKRVSCECFLILIVGFIMYKYDVNETMIFVLKYLVNKWYSRYRYISDIILWIVCRATNYTFILENTM